MLPPVPPLPDDPLGNDDGGSRVSGPHATDFDERRGRATRLVWGLLLMTVGTALFLESLGRITLRPEGDRLEPRLAVDGDPGTRWSSAFGDPEWLSVDLGQPATLTGVTLHWERAYATRYQIQVSDDGQEWRTIVDVDNGDGGIDAHEIDATGRYVRMYGIERATPYGFSLWELEVWGHPGASRSPGLAAAEPEAELLSRHAPVDASSREARNLANAGSYWFILWPLFLVAAGLPAVLVPKNPGDQVTGLLLTAVGVALELRMLGIVDWSFRDVIPVLVAAGGLVLVLQGLGRSGSRR